VCFAAGSVIAVAAMLWFAERRPAGREHWALIDVVVGEGLQINGIFETQTQCLMARGDYLRLTQSEVQTKLEPSGMITSEFGSLTLSCITLEDARGLSSRISDKRK
jgi:hypothetical protein